MDSENSPDRDAPPLPAEPRVESSPGSASPDAAGRPDTEATPSGGTADEGRLLDALRQVIDPELMINVVDLGLVYSVIAEESKVKVEMTLTSPACPAGPQIVQQSKQALERLEGVSEAEIRLVLSPPWTPDRMTDEARDQLGIF